MFAMCRPRKNRSYFWTSSSSKYTFFLKFVSLGASSSMPWRSRHQASQKSVYLLPVIERDVCKSCDFSYPQHHSKWMTRTRTHFSSKILFGITEWRKKTFLEFLSFLHSKLKVTGIHRVRLDHKCLRSFQGWWQQYLRQHPGKLWLRNTGWPASPGPPASLKTRNGHPFRPFVWLEGAPLGGLGLRNFDAGPKCPAPFRGLGPFFEGEKHENMNIRKTKWDTQKIHCMLCDTWCFENVLRIVRKVQKSYLFIFFFKNFGPADYGTVFSCFSKCWTLIIALCFLHLPHSPEKQEWAKGTEISCYGKKIRAPSTFWGLGCSKFWYGMWGKTASFSTLHTDTHDWLLPPIHMEGTWWSFFIQRCPKFDDFDASFGPYNNS